MSFEELSEGGDGSVVNELEMSTQGSKVFLEHGSDWLSESTMWGNNWRHRNYRDDKENIARVEETRKLLGTIPRR